MLTLPYYLQSLKWIVPAGFMLGSAPAYYAVWGSWRVVSSVLPARFFETGDEMLYSMYQRVILFFFENLSGIQITLYGDIDKVMVKSENVVFMCNHQCTVDWMVADILAVKQGSLGNIRYILKDGLKYIPLYGYYFRQHSCIYVKRSGKFNEMKTEKQLDMFTTNGTPFWMVVFPEGTRYNPDLPDVIEKSREFARSKGLPLFEHVLTPRIKALEMCVRQLRPSADAVYDITVAYSSTVDSADGHRTVGPSLADFLQGQCRQVHVHIKRVAIDDVPVKEDEFSDWLMTRFAAKDRLLEKFYSSNDKVQRGSFGPDGRHVNLSVSSTLPSVLFMGALNAAFWLTPSGRALWWRLGLVGSLVSWVWVSIRS